MAGSKNSHQNESRSRTRITPCDVGQELFGRYWARLDRILTENIIPFWYPKCLDTKNGGYLINSDRHGNLTAAKTKMIVSQARMVWFFSRLYRSSYGTVDYRKAAELGYAFLREKMWDQMYGGFYWEVDRTGEHVLKPLKHVYGQAFGLYALSEYSFATGDPKALELAVQLFELLEDSAHDRAHHGYLEFFTPDWKGVSGHKVSYIDGSGFEYKLMNTHLHMMEALISFYRVHPLCLVKERLEELMEIFETKFVRSDYDAMTDKYHHDWTPRLHGKYGRTIYGHTAESIWLIADARSALGLSLTNRIDLVERLFDYALRYGFDQECGGFYYAGALGKPAYWRRKIWWIQAETLICSLYLYSITGNDKYLLAFEKTLKFIENRQIDWKRGEWFAVVLPWGIRLGKKVDHWKTGYHTGRAMLKCLSLLTKR